MKIDANGHIVWGQTLAIPEGYPDCVNTTTTGGFFIEEYNHKMHDIAVGKSNNVGVQLWRKNDVIDEKDLIGSVGLIHALMEVLLALELKLQGGAVTADG